jgi:hypothetical protein
MEEGQERGDHDYDVMKIYKVYEVRDQWCISCFIPSTQVAVEHQVVVWPWSGWFAVKVSATQHAASRGFRGVVKGRITCVVSSVDAQGVKREQALELPVAVQVVPTPRKQQRLLWDQFHSISYPSGYFPRDNLKVWLIGRERQKKRTKSKLISFVRRVFLWRNAHWFNF